MFWGWGASNNNSLRRYGSGMPHEGFESLLIEAFIQGSLLVSKSIDKSRGVEVNGLTEHLHAFIESGVIYATSRYSKRGLKDGDLGASKRRKQSFTLPNQRSMYLEKQAVEQV